MASRVAAAAWSRTPVRCGAAARLRVGPAGAVRLVVGKDALDEEAARAGSANGKTMFFQTGAHCRYRWQQPSKDPLQHPSPHTDCELGTFAQNWIFM